MSRLIKVFPVILACVFLAPGSAAAQTAGALKIAVVDLARVMQESPQYKVTQKALEDEFSPRQRELMSKQNEMKDRQTKLQKDSSVMGAEELRSAESKYRDDARDLDRRQSEFVEDLNVRRNEELGKLQRNLLREVQAFAKQKGYDLVIGEGVLYAAQSINVTAQVLEAVEAGFKSKAPAAAPAPAKP